jgi:hypothetical protein
MPGASRMPVRVPYAALQLNLCFQREVMKLPFKILSTDFDGTLHTEAENPPVPRDLQDLLASLQGRGVIWIINTGRDLPSLLETLNRAQLAVWPDYAVTVEREIYRRENTDYVGVSDWNHNCRVELIFLGWLTG